MKKGSGMDCSVIQQFMMNKYQKYRPVKKRGFESIAILQNNLFNQLQSLNENSIVSNGVDPLFDEFREDDPPINSHYGHNKILLNKAKHLTYSNKGKIERMRREIKRLEEPQPTDFMTGVALFEKETPDYGQPLDENEMFRNLGERKLDDLQELRRMIKKTENNLRMYSHSVYKTQNKVVNAADKIGHQLDTGLAIKINRCNLDQMFSRQVKPRTPSTAPADTIRRRTTTSFNPRRGRTGI